MIKKIILLSSCFLLVTSVVFSQEVIKVGIFDLKPHLYKDAARLLTTNFYSLSDNQSKSLRHANLPGRFFVLINS